MWENESCVNFCVCSSRVKSTSRATLQVDWQSPQATCRYFCSRIQNPSVYLEIEHAHTVCIYISFLTLYTDLVLEKAFDHCARQKLGHEPLYSWPFAAYGSSLLSAFWWHLFWSKSDKTWLLMILANPITWLFPGPSYSGRVIHSSYWAYLFQACHHDADCSSLPSINTSYTVFIWACVALNFKWPNVEMGACNLEQII